MQDVKEIWLETTKRLQKVYDRGEAENISYLLLEDVFGVSKTDVLAMEKMSIDVDNFSALVGRLLKSEPLQYVTGVAHFYGRRFLIKPGALIPRPETEELCDLIIRENQKQEAKILDVGTGSGCIAVTLKAECGGQVYGTDVSEKALAIATENAKLNSADVSFIKSSILDETMPLENLDILVSNPPYIPVKDKGAMHANVLEYEPELALFVPDNDPLLFYREIATKGRHALKDGGRLYFEIHERYGADTKTLLQKVGYSAVIIHQDMQGKDRMISAIN